MSDDERAIREMVETWLRASEAGDVETILGLVAEDVVFTVAGREPFGKALFAEHAIASKDVRMHAEHRVEEITVIDGWAWLRVHLTITMAPPGHEEMRKSGYTLTILRKEEGRWRIARDANLLTLD